MGFELIKGNEVEAIEHTLDDMEESSWKAALDAGISPPSTSSDMVSSLRRCARSGSTPRAHSSAPRFRHASQERQAHHGGG